ncbi:MAG TPA: transposase [Blastocatellia bacterium]|nr:transposase [Blastocatellia bacterium]
MARLDYKAFYRRNLPHLQPFGATLFVTCCLEGSLPKAVLDWYKLQKQRFIAKCERLQTSERAKAELELQRQWFARMEGALHKAETGPTWLEDKLVARVVADALHFHDSKKYRLDAYSIMSNHMHLVIAPLQIVLAKPEPHDEKRDPEYNSLPKILHSIKSFTGHEANKLLEREGHFWQHESYDHSIRDYEEWERVIAYVLNNPVKAGLVKQWQEWPFTYLRQQS